MLDWRQHITSDPQIMVGKPCIKGTRIPVDLILEELAHGREVADLLKGYPRLTNDSIQAVLLFAVDSVRNDVNFDD